MTNDNTPNTATDTAPAPATDSAATPPAPAAPAATPPAPATPTTTAATENDMPEHSEGPRHGNQPAADSPAQSSPAIPGTTASEHNPPAPVSQEGDAAQEKPASEAESKAKADSYAVENARLKALMNNGLDMSFAPYLNGDPADFEKLAAGLAKMRKQSGLPGLDAAKQRAETGPSYPRKWPLLG